VKILGRGSPAPFREEGGLCVSVIRHPVNFAAHHFSVSPIATSSQSVHNFVRCPDHKQTKWSHHPLSLSGLGDV